VFEVLTELFFWSEFPLMIAMQYIPSICPDGLAIESVLSNGPGVNLFRRMLDQGADSVTHDSER
jgi:hypothetical protein